MGKIIIKKGDLFDTTQPIIGHGCNRRNAFASGVAGQVARLFPEVKKAYHGQFKTPVAFPLGSMQCVEITDHATLKIVANLSTQQDYGREPGRVYVDYDAVFRSMSTLLDYADDLGMGVAIPRIGCGLGGGDWNVISNLLMEAMAGRTIDLEVWSP